jgi:hypothetical protein
MPVQRRPRGSAISGALHDAESQRVLRGIGDANIMERGVTLGTGKDGTTAGKTDSVYVSAVLVDAPDQTLALAHSLGRVPGWVTVWEMATSTGAALVQSSDKTSWTKTTIRVRVLKSSGSGSLAGARMTLLVGG